MGTPCKQLDEYLEKLNWSNPNAIILEIGSDRYEGSTLDLANFASQVGAKFITVDVIDDAQHRINHSNIEFVVCSAGSEWCRNELPKTGYSIKILYLDNFDWTWDEQDIPDWIRNQIIEYQSRGVTMNNFNCVQEHFAQLLYCYPKLENQCLVIVDDTLFDPHHGVYIGKCGLVVHYLIHHGFKILKKQDGGIILGRGID